MHGTSPAACAWSTTCSLATLVSTYGTPFARTGWSSVTPSGKSNEKAVTEDR